MNNTTQPETLREVLLPCPFCGGGARQFAGYVRCNKCTAEIATAYSEDAPAAWNTRATPDQKASTQDDVERVKIMQAALIKINHLDCGVSELEDACDIAALAVRECSQIQAALKPQPSPAQDDVREAFDMNAPMTDFQALRDKQALDDMHEGIPAIMDQLVKKRDAENEALAQQLTDRFLWWKLPTDFHPDCGIHFDADAAIKMNPINSKYEPVGTNLFSATQAKEMFLWLLRPYSAAAQQHQEPSEVAQAAKRLFILTRELKKLVDLSVNDPDEFAEIHKSGCYWSGAAEGALEKYESLIIKALQPTPTIAPYEKGFNDGVLAYRKVELAGQPTLAIAGDVVEVIACLEHEQWMHWAKTIVTSEAISAERKTRWFECFKPYHELTEEQKEHDRVWARKVIAAMSEQKPSDGWQSIDSAPRGDGYIIGKMGSVVCTMGWDHDDECWFTFNLIWEEHCRKYIKYEYAQKGWIPTHWQPLTVTIPAPPSQSEGEK